MVITDRHLAAGSLNERLVASAKGGCRWVMVREKDLDRVDLESLVRAIREELAPWNVKVIVNSAFDLVAKLGLAGVHLPQGIAVTAARQSVGGDALIGASVHDEVELRVAESQGADYVTLSPLFPSTSKGLYRTPLGDEEFHRLTKISSVPVIALGGIQPNRVARCKALGAAGVALLGPIMTGDDPARLCLEAIDAWGLV